MKIKLLSSVVVPGCDGAVVGQIIEPKDTVGAALIGMGYAEEVKAESRKPNPEVIQTREPAVEVREPAVEVREPAVGVADPKGGRRVKRT